MRKKYIITLVAALALCLTAFASGDGVTKRIIFAKGKYSATVSGAVVRGDRDTYILGARGGQTMTVRIKSAENNAVFQIKDPDGTYLQNAGEGEDARSLTVDLPFNGDYRIIVGGTRGNASYSLTVTIR